MSKFYFIYVFWVKRVARKMQKDNKVVRKMSDVTKNTLNKIRKMLGDVGNAKINWTMERKCWVSQKNVQGCQENVISNQIIIIII